jgi:antitoxin ParD1/3/4
MDVPVGPEWERFVEQAIKDGRFSSASDVVREGLRLVQDREAKLKQLRETIQRSLATSGVVDDAELDAFLDERCDALAKQGF